MSDLSDRLSRAVSFREEQVDLMRDQSARIAKLETLLREAREIIQREVDSYEEDRGDSPTLKEMREFMAKFAEEGEA